MKEITLLDGKLILDFSPSSEGIWFDSGELNKLINYFGDKLKLSLDKGTMPSGEEISFGKSHPRGPPKS